MRFCVICRVFLACSSHNTCSHVPTHAEALHFPFSVLFLASHSPTFGGQTQIPWSQDALEAPRFSLRTRQ